MEYVFFFFFWPFSKRKKILLKKKVEEGPKTQLKKHGISQPPKNKSPTRVQSYEL
jgi:hypothetical protein